MTQSQYVVLFQLVLAHLIGDFFLQFKHWVTHKETHFLRSKYLYYHFGVHFVFTWLLLGKIEYGFVAFSLAVIHLLIDVVKIKTQNLVEKKYYNNLKKITSFRIKIFIVDQLAHLMILGLFWLGIIHQIEVFSTLASTLFSKYYFLLLLIVFSTVTLPVAIVIHIVTQKWQQQLTTVDEDGLDQAGMWIGIIERVIVLILVLANSYEAIGFLIAAKSFLRFSENRLAESTINKKSEYILIGTLMSFGSAIVLGEIAKILMSRF